MKENSIEEDMKILKEIIKGNEDCINAIYSQMKVKNDNDEDIQYLKKEIQSIENIVNNYLKEKARADKLEKEYSIMLSQLDEREINYKRALKENEEWREAYQEEKDKQFELIRKNQELEKRWDNDTHKLQNDLDIANAKIVELQKELNQENKKCMMLAIEKQDYFEKYRYHLQRNESLTKEFSNIIPVQKVKDKIEELRDNPLRINENNRYYYETDAYNKIIIQVLQELIEREE